MALKPYKRPEAGKYQLPLKNFFWDECHCKDVGFQTYNNTVSMRTPFDLNHRDDRWVTIDACIATEIAYLWNNGVVTLNSCCGHQKTDSNVIVDEACHDLMESLGYSDYAVAPSGLRAYLLKTGNSGTDEAFYEKYKDILG